MILQLDLLIWAAEVGHIHFMASFCVRMMSSLSLIVLCEEYFPAVVICIGILGIHLHHMVWDDWAEAVKIDYEGYEGGF